MDIAELRRIGQYVAERWGPAQRIVDQLYAVHRGGDRCDKARVEWTLTRLKQDHCCGPDLVAHFDVCGSSIAGVIEDAMSGGAV